MAGAVRSAAAAPPETPATLELDTRVLDPEAGARIEAELAEQLGPQLLDCGLVLVDDPLAAQTLVRIRVIAFDADQRDYEIEVQRITTGVEPLGGALVCNACTERRLVSRIVEAAPGLLEPAPNGAAPAEVEAEAAVEAKVEAKVEVEPEPRPKQAPIGAVGIVGSVLGSVGIAIGAVGIYELTRGVVQEPSERQAVVTHNYVPIGAVLTAVGAASLIVGVTMVALDVKRRRSANRSYGFQTSPTYVGIQIEQRF